MKWHDGLALLVALILGAAGCGKGPGARPAVPVGAAAAPPAPAVDASQTKNRAAEEPAALPPLKKIRPAAVAGLFYPRDRDELARTIDGFLAQAKPSPMAHLRGLVCPHAGYEFSGPVAASGYKQLQGRRYRTVIVMGPSHYAYFEGAALPDADAMATPLGPVAVSPEAAQLVASPPLAVNPPCDVQRPDWWLRSPAASSVTGQDTPHTWEHSVEVELPFLQRTLVDFRVIPIVFGRVDPAAVAKAIEKYVDDSTLLVASSDLSHFYPYEQAKQLDDACAKAVCDLDVQRMQRQEACGKGPILALMHLARAKGWKTRLLDCRNSGDTSDDKSRVVGYAAIAFYSDDAAKPSSREPNHSADVYRQEERKLLLELARKSLDAAARGEKAPPVPAAISESLRQPRACFVTLTIDGQLRGCIGSLAPEEPLAEAVVRRARSAALEDPRFPPVTPDEVKRTHIEISVLSLPRPLEFASPEDLLAKLRPGVDGVVLSVGPERATYLPQVWKEIPSKEEFLGSLSRKAGLDASAWKSPEAKVETYQVEAFEEAKP
jgi:AmmeMemoRadiSam system protein B/AmmeMemoRadiSam system protein A